MESLSVIIMVLALIMLFFVISRTKKVNEMNMNAVKEATKIRREILDTQKQILEELKRLNKE